MTNVNRAWADRLEILDAAIAQEEISVGEILNPPALPTLDDVRGGVIANPPPEGKYIAERVFALPWPFLIIWMFSSVVIAILASTYNRSDAGRSTGPMGFLVLGIFSGFFPSVFLTAFAATTAPWFLDRFFKPIDTSAATTRAYAVALIEHAGREQARSDWLLGQSFRAWKEADGATFEKLAARSFRRQGWKV